MPDVDSYNGYAFMLIAYMHNALEEGDDDEVESCLAELVDMGIDSEDIEEFCIEAGIE